MLTFTSNNTTWTIFCESDINWGESLNNPISLSQVAAEKTAGKMVPPSLHVRSVLNFIDNISKLFFLSTFKSLSRFKSLPTWKQLTFWNLWTLCGFFTHTIFHLLYISQNDNSDSRPKLVIVFIDMYNKYCGLFLTQTLVLTGYFQQTSIANINLIFADIEDVFLRQLKIKIKNLNTLRWESSFRM